MLASALRPSWRFRYTLSKPPPHGEARVRKDVKNEGRSGDVYENKGRHDKMSLEKSDICGNRTLNVGHFGKSRCEGIAPYGQGNVTLILAQLCAFAPWREMVGFFTCSVARAQASPGLVPMILIGSWPDGFDRDGHGTSGVPRASCPCSGMAKTCPDDFDRDGHGTRRKGQPQGRRLTPSALR
jgi:hypothetical protein